MKQTMPFIFLLLSVFLSACATEQNHYDPIEPVNRVTDKFNDTVDRITLKPAAQGYTAVVPKPLRTAVSNFFDNVTYPNTILNDFLQGKGEQGFSDLGRLLVNSTLGVAGLFDVAAPMGLDKHDEDFGQTLATWGVGKSAYVVYPLLGPNSLRKTPDFVTATATDPLFWGGLIWAPYITIPVAVIKYVDQRARLLDASNMRDELALDPYVFTREAWHQNRRFHIYDGHPPARQNLEDDDWQEEDFDSEPSTSKNSTSVHTLHSKVTPIADKQKEDTDQNRAHISRPYIINLSSHHSKTEALVQQERFMKRGIVSEIHPAHAFNSTWYRLRSNTPISIQDSHQKLKYFQQLAGLKHAWLDNK
ncbi:MAG: VacJ family lipoprotein [Mariprofundus sp.]|nr:VacJ family lipoprotein [Mariprofundus sp.]